ncbi:UNVERIFIED_ORG: energy-coupling factor transporter transmembrane protein EcfT [Peribacillus simplex]
MPPCHAARGFYISSFYIPIRFPLIRYRIIPLLLTSIQRAENLSLAIDARAYRDGRDRTRFKLLKFKSLDYWTLSILLLVLLGFLFLKVGGEVL